MCVSRRRTISNQPFGAVDMSPPKQVQASNLWLARLAETRPFAASRPALPQPAGKAKRSASVRYHTILPQYGNGLNSVACCALSGVSCLCILTKALLLLCGKCAPGNDQRNPGV